MYRHTPSATGVMRLSDNAFIPFDGGNADYQVYLSWVQLGNAPEPAPLPDHVALAKAALAALERDTMMGRGLREYLLVSMQDLAMRQAEQATGAGTPITAQEILAGNSAWVKLVQIDAQATALRKKITA